MPPALGLRAGPVGSPTRGVVSGCWLRASDFELERQRRQAAYRATRPEPQPPLQPQVHHAARVDPLEVQLIPQPAARLPAVVKRRQLESRRQQRGRGLGAVRAERLRGWIERQPVRDTGPVLALIGHLAREAQDVPLGVDIHPRERSPIHSRPHDEVETRGLRGGVVDLPLGGEGTTRRAARLARPPRPQGVLHRQRGGRPAPPHTPQGNRVAVAQERKREQRTDHVLEEMCLVPEPGRVEPQRERRRPNQSVARPQVPLVVPRPNGQPRGGGRSTRQTLRSAAAARRDRSRRLPLLGWHDDTRRNFVVTQTRCRGNVTSRAGRGNPARPAGLNSRYRSCMF